MSVANSEKLLNRYLPSRIVQRIKRTLPIHNTHRLKREFMYLCELTELHRCVLNNILQLRTNEMSMDFTHGLHELQKRVLLLDDDDDDDDYDDDNDVNNSNDTEDSS